MDLKKFRSVITVAMCLGAIVSGCSQAKTNTVASVPAPAASTPTPVETPKELSAEEKINKFIDAYFKDVTTGLSGESYFCQDGRLVKFFSPRKYEILRTTPARNAPPGQGISFVDVRVESNNQGGQPVIGNKSFSLVNKEPTGKYLSESVKNLGYCIFDITER